MTEVVNMLIWICRE